MPISASKSDELEVRRRVEFHLFTLGMTIQDVAAALNIDTGSVQNDLRKLGGRSAFPSVDQSTTGRREKIFSAALKLFAELGVGIRHDDDSSVNELLFLALARHIDLARIKGIADGVAAIVRRLANPDDPEDLRPYRTLLRTLFKSSPVRLDKGQLLKDYLLHLSSFGDTTSRINRGNIADDISAWAIRTYSMKFMTSLDDSVVLAFDEAFKLLREREAQIIRMRYGLDCPEMTLDEIAEFEDVTRTRIQQIESKVIRKLRRGGYKLLKYFVTSAVANSQAYIGMLYPTTFEPSFLDTTIDALEISVRTYIRLKNAGIMTVQALVERTESELLGPYKLNWKSLKELKGILASHGLGFKAEPSSEGGDIDSAPERSVSEGL